MRVDHNLFDVRSFLPSICAIKMVDFVSRFWVSVCVCVDPITKLTVVTCILCPVFPRHYGNFFFFFHFYFLLFTVVHAHTRTRICLHTYSHTPSPRTRARTHAGTRTHSFTHAHTHTWEDEWLARSQVQSQPTIVLDNEDFGIQLAVGL